MSSVPGSAGLIAQLAGAVTALLLDALSFLVSAACLLRIRTVEPRPRRLDGPPVAAPGDRRGLRFVARDPYLRVLTVFGAASNIGLIGYQAVLVVFLVRYAGLPPGLVGLLIGRDQPRRDRRRGHRHRARPPVRHRPRDAAGRRGHRTARAAHPARRARAGSGLAGSSAVC